MKKNKIPPKEEIYPETNQKMVRPQINHLRVILILITFIVIIGALSWGCIELFILFKWDISLSFGVQFILLYLFWTLLCLIIWAKPIVIFFIRVYQRYAPYEIRCRCFFIPNCSEYMVLAIKKYGLIRGIKKGIKRLTRCHYPNGGIDNP